ncbi:MAG: hypothetical protein PHV34_21600 [Verrucomicrobiae bacterium]|nr:hypothetical protein [Verrucomicrobiae bacterium]
MRLMDRLRGFYLASVLLMFAQNAAAGFQYVFRALMARAVSVADYGLMDASFSLMSLLALPVSTYAGMLSRRWAELHNAGRETEVDDLWWALVVVTGGFAGVVLLAGGLLAPVFGWWLKTPHMTVVWAVMISSCLGMMLALAPPLAMARQWFGLLAVGSLGGAGLRVLVAWAGIQSGHALLVAMLATGLSAGVAMGLILMRVRRPVWRELPLRRLRSRWHEWVAPALSAVTAFVFCGCDLLVVRRFYEPQLAGEFAQVMTLARIIYYFATPLAMVVFPKAATSLLANPQGKENRVVRRAMALCLGSCLLMAAFLHALAPLAFRLLRGGSAAENAVDAGHLRVAVWCLIPLALCQLVTPALFARRQERFLAEFTGLSLLLPLGLMIFRNNLTHAFLVEGAVGLLLLAFIGWRLWSVQKENSSRN